MACSAVSNQVRVACKAAPATRIEEVPALLQSESVYIIHVKAFDIDVEAFDWNCPQHIVPRFTAEQIQQAMAPIAQRIEELEQENQNLRQQLAAQNSRLAMT